MRRTCPVVLPLLCIVFIMTITPCDLSAQSDSRTRSTQSSPQIFGGIEEKAERSLLEESLRLIPQTIIPMEGFVDTLTYIVGPGDVLLINLWGEVEEVVVANVFPQGNIIVPTLGSLDVQGLNLSEVSNRIRERAAQLYPASSITTSLYQVRQIVIHVTGEVQQTGNIIVTPIHRVAEAIKMTGGVSTWADKRRIQITRHNGGTEIFDLFEYEREGKLERNPLVRGGDVIFVPRLDLTGGKVFVDGNIPIPGYYQFYKGETIGEFLRRIQLQRESTDWAHSYLERGSSPGAMERIELPAEVAQMDLSDGMPDNLILQDNDRIYLPKKIDQVYVQGAVMKPGSYAYVLKMKAIDYVGMAGRDDRSGGIDEIKVIRREDGVSLSGGDIIVERGDIIVVPLKKTAKLLEYLNFVAPVTSLIITAAAVGIISK